MHHTPHFKIYRNILSGYDLSKGLLMCVFSGAVFLLKKEASGKVDEFWRLPTDVAQFGERDLPQGQIYTGALSFLNGSGRFHFSA